MISKVIGIGLNKTATKSLAQCFKSMGYRNQSYSIDAFTLYRHKDWQALFNIMDQYDSFEDWPWPLMYKEIDRQYPEAKFILTTRASPELWYRSLCKMAVRMGPLKQFEQAIYGFSMPQGHREDHINYYNKHNREVKEYFSDRPGKLLEICFDNGVSMPKLCEFLNQPQTTFTPPHTNKSANVYSGDSIYRAQFSRIVFQSRWNTIQWLKKRKRQIMKMKR